MTTPGDRMATQVTVITIAVTLIAILLLGAFAFIVHELAEIYRLRKLEREAIERITHQITQQLQSMQTQPVYYSQPTQSRQAPSAQPAGRVPGRPGW